MLLKRAGRKRRPLQWATGAPASVSIGPQLITPNITSGSGVALGVVCRWVRVVSLLPMD